MIFCPRKYISPVKNVNEYLKTLQGELDEKEARLTLIDFLRANIGFTVELISGIKLEPYQEIILKGMLQRQRTMAILSRGGAKSWMSAVFCFLQTIFEPGTKVLLAGPTFRTSRIIFAYLEKMVKSPGAELLMQAFSSNPVRRNDYYAWEINNGNIMAIPLNGERVRGARANVLVIDEYLLMPKDIIDYVLMPFLAAPLDIAERIKIREIEDKLLAEGLIREEQRVKFENNSKMIALSSASYTFENLYTTYQDWKSKIYSDEIEQDDCKYFIAQMSYEALPPHMVDSSVTEEAKNGGASKASFQREYCAQFVDESDGYFSAKKMNDITLKDGEEPTTLLSAREGKKYILSIDPSFSKSKTSDFFAMAVMELDEEKRDAILVHGYAAAGADLKQHIKYLYYLLTYFNPELVIIDNADFSFIDAANESVFFKNKNKHLSFLEIDSDLEGMDYQKNLQSAKQKWNKQDGKICFRQIPSVEFIRRSNQHLQACIDHKRVWFASNVRACAPAWEKAINTNIPKELIPFEDVGELAEFQDDVIYQTKVQCALIEITTTAKGTQSFDLPAHLKRDNTEKRARRDNYTALLLANWATKIYFEMQEVKFEAASSFTPFFI